MNSPKYFLYARKSTDEDDRQILSIESQLTELREFARKERLTIAHEFTESMSAKMPGRPVFNHMMELAEGGGSSRPGRVAPGPAGAELGGRWADRLSVKQGQALVAQVPHVLV